MAADHRATMKAVPAEHGVICARPGERFSYFGWPSVARLGDGSLLTVYYQKLAADQQPSLLWSRWELPGSND